MKKSFNKEKSFYLSKIKKLTIFALFDSLLIILGWIVPVFMPELSGRIKEFSPLIAYLRKIADTRGPEECIKYIKLVRQALLIHLSGEFPEKAVTGIGLTNRGIPRCLGPLRKYIVKTDSPSGEDGTVSVAMLRLILTVLFSTRSLKAGKNPDIASIITPQSNEALDYVNNPNCELYKHIRSFWRHLGFPTKRSNSSIPSKLKWKQYHFTTKSGPNGHALFTCFMDLFLLPSQLVQDLKTMGGEKFSRYIDPLLRSKDVIASLGLPIEGYIFRKIAWFPDMEMKVRVIAIGDYFSQTVLRCLHFFIFRILKTIPQDCTFSQGSFTDKIKDWTVFHSIDLTAATDRFPIQVIYQVLKGYLPNDYCNAWKRTMVEYPFYYKPTKSFISYAVGNPMGFYSSWASFALAHHYVMFYCARELNIPWKEAKYVLLGDDILIGDTLLANKYKQVLAHLECEFSPMKTHDSTTLCEFAKRYVYKGKEITPFPVSALWESHKKYFLMVNLLSELSERGWVSIDGVPSAIRAYYEHVLSFNANKCKEFFTKSVACELVLKFTRGTVSANDCLNTIARQNNVPIQDFTVEEESMTIIQSLIVEAFANSNPVNSKTSVSGVPLGDFAINLVIGLTCQETEIQPEFVPQLYCYGLVEESFLDLSREAYRIDTVGKGDWPLLLKTMALPLDDRIFVQRTSHLIVRASALIGEKILERFKVILQFYPHYRRRT